MLFASVALAAVTLSDFAAWQKEHKRAYSTRTEAAHRYRIFQDNAVRIEAMQRNNPRATFKLNKFGDLTRDEFRGMYNKFSANISAVRQGAPVAARMDTSNLAASFDWRTKSGILAPVQDQGQCGSCWAFSATVNMESRYALANGQRVNKLAEQALVDCDQLCGQYRFFNGCDAGCNGGLQPNAFKYAIANGMPTEDSYPYTGTGGTCQSFSSVAKFSSWEFVSTDEKQIAAYLSKTPISVAVDASNWQFYNGGIMTGTDVCPAQDPNSPSLDHGVAIIGYGTEGGQDYWIIRNSWAASWGEQGYCRIARGTDYCGVALFACSVLP